MYEADPVSTECEYMKCDFPISVRLNIVYFQRKWISVDDICNRWEKNSITIGRNSHGFSVELIG